MKKGLRKLSSMVLAVFLVITMVSPSFADPPPKVNITIENAGTGSEFKAYKLLDAKFNEAGDGVTYKVNVTYSAALQAVTSKTTDEEIIAYIQALAPGNKDSAGIGTGIRTFADAMYQKLKELNKLDSGINPDTAEKNKFKNIDPGYYLIIETKPGEDGIQSLAMLGTPPKGGTFTINSKNNNATIPTVEKKVKEKDDSTGTTTDWQDAADYDLNDDVPFRLKVKLPENIDHFLRYKFVITDTLGAGFTFNNDDITNDQKFKITTDEGGNDSVKDKFKITYAGQVLTIVPNAQNVGLKEDLRQLYKEDTLNKIKGKTLYITYYAKLNTSAVIGNAGNANTVKVTYATDPYWNGTPATEPTKDTPEDKVKVFTYRFFVKKVKEDGNTELKGAEFKLYKADTSHGQSDDDTDKASGTKWKNVPLTTTIPDLPEKFKETIFLAERIDAGKYRLVETKAPDGYNAMDPIEFTITATYPKTADDPLLTGLAVTPNTSFSIDEKFHDKELFTPNKSRVSVKIKNEKGAKLPETGGRGTTLIYLLGAVFTFAAGVILISRKRMNINK